MLDDLVKHKITKDILLKDFDQVGECKFLVFNSSITSGVDYSGNNFDMGLHFA